MAVCAQVPRGDSHRKGQKLLGEDSLRLRQAWERRVEREEAGVREGGAALQLELQGYNGNGFL